MESIKVVIHILVVQNAVINRKYTCNCKFANVRENLAFMNICKFDASNSRFSILISVCLNDKPYKLVCKFNALHNNLCMCDVTI